MLTLLRLCFNTINPTFPMMQLERRVPAHPHHRDVCSIGETKYCSTLLVWQSQALNHSTLLVI